MNARPLSIALVSREYPPFYGGGIGTYARAIVPALTAQGVRVHVVTEAHDKLRPRVEVDGLTTVHRVPALLGRGGWTNTALRFSIHAGRVVGRLWAAGQIDVAEFAECEAAGLATTMTPPRDRPPTVIQLHTPSEQLFGLRSLSSRALDASLSAYLLGERLALGLADGLLAPSRFIAEWAANHYQLAVTPEVIPYAWGDLPGVNDTTTGDEARADGASPTVLYVGRIEPRKGTELLVRAWSKVLAQHPGARLRLVGGDTGGAPGGGSMQAYLEELAADAGVGPSVQFLGRLEAGALAGQYAGARLVVVPSLWENFPNTCIEAMSHARPVLASDAGGMREMLGDGGAGQTFVSGDADDLATQLIGMLDEGDARLNQRGALARQRIAAYCDPQRIAQQRIEHFQRVIDAHRAGRDIGGDRRAFRRATWRRFEALAAGGVSGGVSGGGDSAEMGLPEPAEAVRRWVERAAQESAR